MAELVKGPNPIEIDERIHLEHPLDENIPLDKPIRGPDDELWLLPSSDEYNPARVPVTEIDTNPWSVHPEFQDDERRYIPLHRPNPIYFVDDAEGWSPMTPAPLVHQLSVTSPDEPPAVPVLELPEVIQNPPTSLTTEVDLEVDQSVPQREISSFQKLVSLLHRFNDSGDSARLTSSRNASVPEPNTLGVELAYLPPESADVIRSKNGSVPKPLDVGLAYLPPESVDSAGAASSKNESLPKSNAFGVELTLLPPKSGNLQFVSSTRKPPFNRTRYTSASRRPEAFPFRTSTVASIAVRNNGTQKSEIRTTDKPLPVSDPPGTTVGPLIPTQNSTSNQTVRAELIVKANETTNPNRKPESADFNETSTSKLTSNQSNPIKTTDNPVKIIQRSKELQIPSTEATASAPTTQSVPTTTESARTDLPNDQPFPETEGPTLTLEPWELDVRSGKVDLLGGQLKEPASSSASLVDYSAALSWLLMAVLMLRGA